MELLAKVATRVVIIAVVGGALIAASDNGETPKIDTARPPHAQLGNSPGAIRRGPIVGTVPMVDFDEQYAIDQVKIAQYLAAVEAERIRLEQEQREREEQERTAAAAEAARVAATRQTPRSQPVSSGNTTGGDCSAVAAVVGAGTVQRESGGNPAATNGQYLGCAQISTGWWNGACSGLDWHNVADQAACARIVMQLQGPSAWATTYGG